MPIYTRDGEYRAVCGREGCAYASPELSSKREATSTLRRHIDEKHRVVQGRGALRRKYEGR